MARVPELRSLDEYLALYPDDRAEVADVEAVLERLRDWGDGVGSLRRAFGLMLHHPRLAKLTVDVGDYIENEMPWTRRTDRKELVFQAVAKRLGCEYLHAARYDAALRAGLSAAQLAALDFPRSGIFDLEQRLVLEITFGALDDDVPAALFEEALRLYGERGALELSVTVCYAVWWAMFCNVLRPEPEPR